MKLQCLLENMYSPVYVFLFMCCTKSMIFMWGKKRSIQNKKGSIVIKRLNNARFTVIDMF